MPAAISTLTFSRAASACHRGVGCKLMFGSPFVSSLRGKDRSEISFTDRCMPEFLKHDVQRRGSYTLRFGGVV
jgi:hypothetical protein